MPVCTTTLDSHSKHSSTTSDDTCSDRRHACQSSHPTKLIDWKRDMAGHEEQSTTHNIPHLPDIRSSPTLRTGQLPPWYKKQRRVTTFSRLLLVRFTRWTQPIEDPEDHKRFLRSQSQAWGDLELSTTTKFAEMQAMVCKELERMRGHQSVSAAGT